MRLRRQLLYQLGFMFCFSPLAQPEVDSCQGNVSLGHVRRPLDNFLDQCRRVCNLAFRLVRQRELQTQRGVVGIQPVSGFQCGDCFSKIRGPSRRSREASAS